MNPTRRQFLSFSGSAGIGLLCRAAAGGHAAGAVTIARPALGTTVSITALHADAARARLAIEAAFAELERVESVMSLYREDSQVSRLNREGQLRHPHPCLLQVLAVAADVATRTRGAFDITVQSLWRLHAATQDEGRSPTAIELRAAGSRVNWRHVAASEDRVQLHAEAQITLNGIAQGFAVDRVTDALRQQGIAHALVDTGELGALGESPRGDAWQIGIQHPRAPEAWIAVAELGNRCLATSGDYSTSFSEDFARNHLFDPRTGRSPRQLSSVTVVADRAVQADALSTAIAVLGLDAGAALIRRTPGTAMLAITKSGRVVVTEGFPLADQPRVTR